MWDMGYEIWDVELQIADLGFPSTANDSEA
jgi:hypothetical protein